MYAQRESPRKKKMRNLKCIRFVDAVMAAGGSKPAPGGACWPRVPVCIVPSGICFIFGDLGHFRSRHFVLLLFIYIYFAFVVSILLLLVFSLSSLLSLLLLLL